MKHAGGKTPAESLIQWGSSPASTYSVDNARKQPVHLAGKIKITREGIYKQLSRATTTL